MADEIKRASRALRAKDISILRSLNSPPNCVKDVVLCVFYLNPTGNESQLMKATKDNWGLIRNMLSEATFLECLKGYKKEQMTLEMFYRIARILRSYEPMLDVEQVKVNCSAAVGLFKWMMALMKYYSDHNDVYAVPSQSQITQTSEEIAIQRYETETEAEIEAFETRLLELENKAKEAEEAVEQNEAEEMNEE